MALCLTDLPRELLLRVATNLDPYELSVLGRVCRQLHALSRDPALLVDLDLPAIKSKHGKKPRSRKHLLSVSVPQAWRKSKCAR